LDKAWGWGDKILGAEVTQRGFQPPPKKRFRQKNHVPTEKWHKKANPPIIWCFWVFGVKPSPPCAGFGGNKTTKEKPDGPLSGKPT